MAMKYDFSGWATRNNLKCSDGRTIMRDAFKHNDGRKVPLVWNHQHNNPEDILGNAILENRDEGVYAYGTFNDTESGKAARSLVQHGDVEALSIYANQLKQQGGNVLHGEIREVSLVLGGANPGAYIDSIIRHGEESEDEGIIYTGERLELVHSDEDNKPPEKEKKPNEDSEPENKNVNGGKDDMKDTLEHADKTVADVFNTFTEEQKTVVYALIGQALEDAGVSEKSEGGEDVKHNVFDKEDDQYTGNALSHSDGVAIIADAKRHGSLKESALAHGIDNIDYLFPDARTLTDAPEFIKRPMEWVPKVMNGVGHTPFSRIKSIFADITEDDARAKGYIKGKLKKDEVFGLLKRTTTPTTIYKKQKLERDDVIDIVDFDVVAWLKTEMRMMLDEEIARAVLVGDGRLVGSDDHISEDNIRPVWKDVDLYNIKAEISVASDATADQKAKAFIRTAIKARKDYKGSGNPTLYTTEDILTDCLLLEDNMGRVIYDSVTKLTSTLRVSEIVTVPVMENLTRIDDKGTERTLMGIIVNLNDYKVGADKGGAVNMFDDFDIDYNAMKYLIETRCSGALVKPYSAISLELVPLAAGPAAG